MEYADRRTRKTKKAIYEALVTLLERKEPDKITVKELVEAADINRSTFYNHYRDIYALYDEISDNIVREVDSIFSEMKNAGYTQLIRALIDRILENRRLFRLVLDNSYGRDNLTQLLKNKYIHMVCGSFDTENVSDKVIFDAVLNVNGVVAVLKLWAEKDYSYPKEKLVRLLDSVNRRL